MAKLKVGLFFGGRSTEHEVSVLTALQAFENLDKEKYEVIPIYVSKQGNFYTNPKLLNLKKYQNVKALLQFSSKITLGRKNNQAGFFTRKLFGNFTVFDVALLSFHGSFGEDGCMQGLLEMYQIPYTGFNVMASAVAMDKVVSKAVFQNLQLPIGKYLSFPRVDWVNNPKKILKEITKSLNYPLFIKPATIGSSIGVNKVLDSNSLSFAIEVASTYTEKILVEEAFENALEVNCSALGYGQVQASVCEMPMASSEILSFADKYQRGGKGSKGSGMAAMTRIIPAPIPEKLAKQIQTATQQIFTALDGCGVARVDYFIDKEKQRFWVNEVNSPPGSFAFYLWEKSGIKFSQLLDMLIEFALQRATNQSKTQYVFESGLLSQMAQAGGMKS